MHIHNAPVTKQDTHGGDNDNRAKRFQDMCLFMSNDSERFSGIWNDLDNNTLMNIENYPKTPDTANDVLCLHRNLTPPHKAHAPPGAVSFVQHGNTGSNTVPVNYRQSFIEVTCYLYHQMGHYAGNFPSYTSSTRMGSQSL